MNKKEKAIELLRRQKYMYQQSVDYAKFRLNCAVSEKDKKEFKDQELRCQNYITEIDETITWIKSLRIITHESSTGNDLARA